MSLEPQEEIIRLLGELSAKVENIEKVTVGNGQPGLSQRVQELEGGQKFLWGIGTAVTALGGFVEWIIHRH